MLKTIFSNLEEKYINDFEAWQIYNCLRLHFQTTNYSIVKYGFTNEKYGWNAYLGASDYEVKLFDKLAKYYQTNINLIYALSANFFYLQPKGTWEITTIDELTNAYIKLKQFNMSPKYYLDNDLTYLINNVNISVLKVVNNNVPEIYTLAHNGLISYESLVLLDFSTGITKYVSNKLKDSIMWSTYKYRYMKYQPFVCTMINKDLVNYIQNQLRQLQS